MRPDIAGLVKEHVLLYDGVYNRVCNDASFLFFLFAVANARTHAQETIPRGL
jgi:hypothetical protein